MCASLVGGMLFGVGGVLLPVLLVLLSYYYAISNNDIIFTDLPCTTQAPGITIFSHEAAGPPAPGSVFFTPRCDAPAAAIASSNDQ